MNRLNERMVTLLDGRQASNYSEDWRHECEARAILAMPTLARRRAFLYGVQESTRQANGKWLTRIVRKGVKQTRGDDELRRLEATMVALWKARRAANDNTPAQNALEG